MTSTSSASGFLIGRKTCLTADTENQERYTNGTKTDFAERN